ncbi:HNH endonuclease [Shewanella algae]|uniref:HNH endonuclease n=1 Tax=Shewanella algae TaxID=38313 RepID=UPI0031F59715
MMFNTTRSANAPDCLNDQRYNTKEVVELLEPMFFGKCYLCEQDELSDPEIEHFDPHQGDTSKKYDWENLYYSCGRCNSIKSYVHTNLLNCCDPNVDVFRAIKCILPSTPDSPISVAATINPNDTKTINTVNLVYKCYNEDNTPLRGITRSVLMEKLFEHYTDFLTYRSIIRNKRSTDNEREHAKDRMLSMLLDSFPFSVFWKWHVLSDTFLSEYLDGEINF